eukprot:6202140-Pleurochrysis_carterae.AAC.1
MTHTTCCRGAYVGARAWRYAQVRKHSKPQLVPEAQGEHVQHLCEMWRERYSSILRAFLAHGEVRAWVTKGACSSYELREFECK